MSYRTTNAAWDDTRKYWRVRVQRDGVRREFTCSTPGKVGQRKCNAKADAWLDGSGVDALDRIRVSDAIEEFALYRAEIVATRRKVKPPTSYDDLKGSALGTYRAEISLLNNWLRPRFGTRWLHKIGDSEFQLSLELAVAGGLSRKSCKDLRNAVTQLLRYFRAKGQTEYKPDEVRVPPQARSGEKTVLALREVQKLFTSVSTIYKGKPIDDPLIHAYRLAVLNGPRPGELIGLEWPDWDGSNTISIRRSINVDGDITTGKNDNAVRDLKLSPLAVQEIKAQHLQQGRPRVGRMFPQITNQRYFRDRWRYYCQYNGITPVTPYELRHTFVSIAQKQLPDYLLKPVVGHSKDMDTHGIYGHIIDGFDDETGKLLGQVFDSILSSDEKKVGGKVGG